MSNITLFCLIQGDKFDNNFRVDIKNSKSVSDLKEEIKKKKPDFFVNVNISKLWKVNIPFKEKAKINILKTQPVASVKEFEGKELDTTKKIVDYFSYEFSVDKKIHIIVQREQINVAIFGLTGHGKSSIANMLIQGDIYRKKNVFQVNDGGKGGTTKIQGGVNEIFEVYDTIGLGEPASSGSVPHKKAVGEIRKHFPTCEVLFNYIFYVKKKGRFTEIDVSKFKEFKRLFGDGEKNFIIVITDSDPKWVEKNSETIEENFGNYPIIPVDFPWSDDDDDDDAQYNQKKRAQSLRILIDELLMPKYKGIKLEVLSSFQFFLASFVDLTYQLISSVKDAFT